MRRSRPTVIAWTGICYRTASYDVPLWARPNRRSGRFNRAGAGCTQYLALDPEAPFAEKLRYENLRTEEEAQTYRTTLWQLRIDEGSVVDYSTFEKAEAAGFPPDALVDDDHERCHDEAEWLIGHGVRGILSPSAALPGSLNLTLFGPRVAVDWGAPVGLASTVRAQKLATTNPPQGVVERVRFYGEPHPSLVVYSAAVAVRRRARRGEGR